MEQNSFDHGHIRETQSCLHDFRTARFDHHTIRGRKRKMSRKSGFIQEFKKFILRGNVMDMAVGVIVGGAFTAIRKGKRSPNLPHDSCSPKTGTDMENRWRLEEADLLIVWTGMVTRLEDVEAVCCTNLRYGQCHAEKNIANAYSSIAGSLAGIKKNCLARTVLMLRAM